MTDSEATNDDRVSAVLELPLRGLAGEGAEDRVRAALQSVPGIASVRLGDSSFIIRIQYDGSRTDPDTIRHALHSIGVDGGSGHAVKDRSAGG